MARLRRHALPRLAELATAALFVFTAEILVFHHFFKHHRSLVWQADGLAQHFPAFYFVRETLSSFLRHPGDFPQWSWQLGFGADVIGTLSYYLADPFAWLSLLFPLAWAERVYFLLFLVRILAAGLAGYAYLRSMRTSRHGALIGTLVYTFGMFTMFAARHPYFVDAMVWFPLLLLGIEKVLSGRRWYLLALSAAALAASNVYFLYQIGIVAALYTLARWIETTPRGERIARFGAIASRAGGAFGLGLMLAAGVLLPVVLAGMASTRMATSASVPVLQTAAGYRSYLVALAVPLAGKNSAYMGFSMLAFMALPVVLARRRRDAALKVMLLAFPLTLLTPLAGAFMNTLEFPSYRFLFMWGLFLGLAAARVMSQRSALSRSDLALMAVALAAYGGLSAYGAGDSALTRLAVLLTFLLGVVMWIVLLVRTALSGRLSRIPGRAREFARGARTPAVAVLITILVLVGITANGVAMFDPAFTPRIVKYLARGSVLPRFMKNAGSQVSNLTGDGPFRVDNQARVHGADLEPAGTNDQLVQGYRGVTFYYSIMDDGVFRFVDELDDRGIRLGFDFSGLDGRAALEAVTGVRYYVAKAKGAQFVPFGFEATGTIGNASLYENRYALPLGFVYHASLPEEDYAKLSPLEKQQSLLRSAVIEGVAPAGAPTTVAAAPEVVSLPTTITPFEARLDTGRRILRIVEKGGGVLIEVPPVANAELYVSVEGIEQRPPKGGYLAVSASTGGQRKTEVMHAPTSGYYFGNDSVLINLGYFAQTPSSVYVMVGRKTKLRYRRIAVHAVRMDSFPSDIARLADEGLRDVRITTNAVSGTFTARGDGLLFLSIPRSVGWRATVDGRPVPIRRTNVGFSGIAVTGGTHRLRMEYRTPGLQAGMAISAIGVLVFGAAAYATERRRKRGVTRAGRPPR